MTEVRTGIEMNASTEPPFTEEEIIHMLLNESPIAKNIIKHLIFDLFEGRGLEQLKNFTFKGAPITYQNPWKT